jgi:ubiquinone/menaquinone biosynthesis C-methylase UbiE
MGNTDKFEAMANVYDNAERIQIAKVSSDAIREYLNDTKNKNAIDFGCGTGFVGMDLLKEFKSVLFLDTSQNMINVVNKKILDSNVLNAETLCFDFESAFQTDIYADYIFMVQVLLHIKDVKLVLSKLYDVLTVGGHLLIIDFNRNEEVISDLVHNGFEQEELIYTMEKLGYKEIKSKTFYYGNNIFMGKNASLFIIDSQK